jgi:hypothetical protein
MNSLLDTLKLSEHVVQVGELRERGRPKILVGNLKGRDMASVEDSIVRYEVFMSVTEDYCLLGCDTV